MFCTHLPCPQTHERKEVCSYVERYTLWRCFWNNTIPTPATFPPQQMCLLLREALSVGRIAFHPNFTSTEPGPDQMKRRIVDELSNFCVVNEPAKSTFGKVQRKSVASHAVWSLCSVSFVLMAGEEDVHGQA